MSAFSIRLRFFCRAMFCAALAFASFGAGSALSQNAPGVGASIPEPTLSDLLDQLALTQGEQGERLAREVQRRWAISKSDTANLFLGWADRALENRDSATAMDMLDQVIITDPGFVEGYHRRGALHYQSENFGAAIQDLYIAIRIEPRHYGALVGLASSLAHLGEDEQALEMLERAYEVNPSYEQGRSLYERLKKDYEGGKI